MFDSVSTAVETLSSEYADHPDVETAFDLSEFFDPARSDATKGDSSVARTSRRSEAKSSLKRGKILADAAPERLAINTAVRRLAEVIEDGSMGATRSGVYVDLFDDLFAFAAVVTEMRERYAGAPVADAVDALNEAIDAADADDLSASAASLRRAGATLYERAVVVRRGDQLAKQIEHLSEPQFGGTKDRLLGRIETAIANGDRATIDEVAERLAEVREGTWTREDLLACSNREFEVLVADLWREGGFDARTTKYVQDFNIDVVVSTESGIDLIQAKQYKPGNTVGVGTVQRTAGLIVEFGADEVYVVTSSSFTSNAHTSAERMEHEVTLVNGEQLCELLTESQLVPPV